MWHKMHSVPLLTVSQKLCIVLVLLHAFFSSCSTFPTHMPHPVTKTTPSPPPHSWQMPCAQVLDPPINLQSPKLCPRPPALLSLPIFYLFIPHHLSFLFNHMLLPPCVYPLTGYSSAFLVSHELAPMPARPPPSQCGDLPLLRHFDLSCVSIQTPTKLFIEVSLLYFLPYYCKVSMGGGFTCGIKAGTGVEMRLNSGYLRTL